MASLTEAQKDQLVALIRKNYENVATKIEKIIEFIFQPPEPEGILLLELLLCLWDLPGKGGRPSTELPTFQVESFEKVGEKMDELYKNHEFQFCQSFHTGLKPAEIAEQIYKQLVRINQLGRPGQVLYLYHLLENRDHIPLAWPDSDESKKSILAGSEVEDELAKNPKLFSQTSRFIIDTFYGEFSPLVFAEFIQKRIANLEDERQKLAFLSFLMGRMIITAVELVVNGPDTQIPMPRGSSMSSSKTREMVRKLIFKILQTEKEQDDTDHKDDGEEKKKFVN